MSELTMLFIDKNKGIDTFIRGKKNEFGYEIWSVYDFINAVAGLNSANVFGDEVFADLSQMEHEHYCRIMPYCSYARFADYENIPTPTMTASGLVCLLSILEEDVVESPYRELAEMTLTRVMNGDRSRIKADGDVAGESVSIKKSSNTEKHHSDGAGSKRTRDLEEIELEEKQLSLDERKIALAKRKLGLEDASRK